jgi:hypothetical protein
MAKSVRERDFYRMRQLGKQMRAMFPKPCSSSVAAAISATPKYKALERQFDRLWTKYGRRSEVSDKGRDRSRRRALAKRQTVRRRATRRRQALAFKLELLRELSRSKTYGDA